MTVLKRRGLAGFGAFFIALGILPLAGLLHLPCLAPAYGSYAHAGKPPVSRMATGLGRYGRPFFVAVLRGGLMAGLVRSQAR